MMILCVHEENNTATESDTTRLQTSGSFVPYSNHNADYQVDLDAIPLGVKIGAAVRVAIFCWCLSPLSPSRSIRC